VLKKGVFRAFFRLIRLDYSFFSAFGVFLSGLLAGDLVGFQIEYLVVFLLSFFLLLELLHLMIILILRRIN
jgi:hypothetical protein